MVLVHEKHDCFQTQTYLLFQIEMVINDLLFLGTYYSFLRCRILMPCRKDTFYAAYFPPSICEEYV